jgi:hypothetical protein
MTAVNKSNALTKLPVAVAGLLKALVQCVDVRDLTINRLDFWLYKWRVAVIYF